MATPKENPANRDHRKAADTEHAPPRAHPRRAWVWTLAVVATVLLVIPWLRGETGGTWMTGWGLALLLLVIVCPLSMYFMMRGAGHGAHRKKGRDVQDDRRR